MFEALNTTPKISRFTKHIQRALLLIALSGSLSTGCASYATPGQGADLQRSGFLGTPEPIRATLSKEIALKTEASIRENLDRQPSARLPARVALAHIQAPTHAYGPKEEHFRLVTRRAFDMSVHYDTLKGLPQIADIAPLSSAFFTGRHSTALDLRNAAATLRADLLMVYTFDTWIRHTDRGGLFSVLTLGLLPDAEALVSTTGSAVLLDTRTGFVYGLLEAGHEEEVEGTIWGIDVKAEEASNRVEEETMHHMVAKFESLWSQILSEHDNAQS